MAYIYCMKLETRYYTDGLVRVNVFAVHYTDGLVRVNLFAVHYTDGLVRVNVFAVHYTCKSLYWLVVQGKS